MRISRSATQSLFMASWAVRNQGVVSSHSCGRLKAARSASAPAPLGDIALSTRRGAGYGV